MELQKSKTFQKWFLESWKTYHFNIDVTMRYIVYHMEEGLVFSCAFGSHGEFCECMYNLWTKIGYNFIDWPLYLVCEVWYEQNGVWHEESSCFSLTLKLTLPLFSHEVLRNVHWDLAFHCQN
jgi:hypothetical protein